MIASEAAKLMPSALLIACVGVSPASPSGNSTLAGGVGRSAERRPQDADVRDRDGIGIFSVTGSKTRAARRSSCSARRALKRERLDVRVGVHVHRQRGLRHRDADVGAEVGDARARRRAGLDVEDVAAVRGQLAQVGEVGAAAGSACSSSGFGKSGMTGGMPTGAMPRAAYLARIA